MQYIPSYNECRICARLCGANRALGELGVCRASDRVVVARAALHKWEEPIISGERGSGTIFFSGCSLGCIYCQNREISREMTGKEVSLNKLADIMLRLESEGAHNINLVTPTHYVPTIYGAINKARSCGLEIPIVYNTGTLDSVDSIRYLDGCIDVYLPDFKFYLSKTAKAYANAPTYPTVAREAIAEMVRQRPHPVIQNGVMTSGVIARVLLLPSHVAEAKLTVKYLYSTYGDSVYISLMNQYTPMSGMSLPLNRAVTRAEYYDLVEYAENIGVKNGFTQSFGTASESFIPVFDNSGV